MIAQMQQQLQPQPAPLPPPPPKPQQPVRSSTTVIADFCRLQPPIFTGKGDPMLATKWLEQMGKFLKLLSVINDATSIKLVAFQLRDSAEVWWRSIRNSRDITGLTWMEFSELFLQHYFPDVIKDMKRLEFIKFEQGTLSVSDYETRFTAMSKFAKEMVSTKNLKCKRFEDSLIDAI